MYDVDLGESFHINVYLQNLASIQLRSSPVKFVRSQCTDPSGSQSTSHSKISSFARVSRALCIPEIVFMIGIPRHQEQVMSLRES